MDTRKGFMTQHTKLITLILLVGTLVSLILLSASLSSLQLHNGTPFPGAGDSGSEIKLFANPISASTYSFTILKGIFALVFLILMIYIPVRLLTLITIKRVFHLLFVMVILLVVIIVISCIPPDRSTGFPGDSSDIANPFSTEHPVSSLEETPQELIHVVLIVFVLGAGLLTLKALKFWLHAIRVKEQLLQEVETAVDAIKGGENLRNVILHCYLQMTHLLKEEQGIERSYNMTAREFEDWLESKGFPTIPVHQLTCLFEKVRYGTMPTMKEDEKTAVESLNEIIRFCRSERN